MGNTLNSSANLTGLRGAFHRFGETGANSLVVAVLAPFILLRSEWVRRALLAVVILDIPLQLGTHLYYREADAALGALGGLGISATTLALAGLYGGWLLTSRTSRNGEPQPSVEINFPLLIYVVISTLSLVVAQDVSLAFFEVCLNWEMYLLFLYVANSVRSRQDVSFVFSLLMIGAIVESLVIIVLRFTGMPSTIWGIPAHIYIDTDAHSQYMRIGGTVGSPNQAAAYFSLLLAPALSLLFTALPKIHKRLAALAFGLGGVALVFTFSRGGWIAFTLSITMLLLLVRRRVSLIGPIAAAVILALLYLPFHNSISQRVFSDDHGSAESRVPLMSLAFRIIHDNPIMGVGSNNFQLVMNRYLTSEFREGFRYAVHNKYLLVLSETGSAGFLAYIAFFLTTLRKGWQTWKLGNGFLAVAALGFTAAITGHMVHMSVEVFRGRPNQQLVWLLAALLSAMYRICVAEHVEMPLSEMS